VGVGDSRDECVGVEREGWGPVAPKGEEELDPCDAGRPRGATRRDLPQAIEVDGSTRYGI